MQRICLIGVLILVLCLGAPALAVEAPATESDGDLMTVRISSPANEPKLDWEVLDPENRPAALDDPNGDMTVTITSIPANLRVSARIEKYVTANPVILTQETSNTTNKRFVIDFVSSEGPGSVHIRGDAYRDGAWRRARDADISIGERASFTAQVAYPVRFYVWSTSGSDGKCYFNYSSSP